MIVQLNYGHCDKNGPLADLLSVICIMKSDGGERRHPTPCDINLCWFTFED